MLRFLRSLAALWRGGTSDFSVLEEEILAQVEQRLDADRARKLRQRIESINLVQRHDGGREVNAYSLKNGKPTHDESMRLTAGDDEEKLASFSFLGRNQVRYAGAVWVVNGQFFSIEFNKITEHALEFPPTDLEVTVYVRSSRLMDADQDVACAAVPVPSSLSEKLTGYEWAQNKAGPFGDAVYRLYGKRGAPDLFLKHGRDSVADDLADEMGRLRWLAAYIPVPAVTHFIGTPDEAWLLMTALPGEPADRAMSARPDDRIAIVDALASFLRRLHAIPVSQCPFNSDHAYRLGLARKRIDAEIVNEVDLDDEGNGPAARAWASMQRLLPFAPDPVVTHGDFSLDNLFVSDSQVIGCLDVGRAGIADRYQDLATLWKSLGAFDASLQTRLFDQYGIADVDQSKLQFHLMLDEIFRRPTNYSMATRA